MTDPINFALAVLFLLSVPGPTNTLLATAATANSFRNCLSLMPAEMAGYTISINILPFVRPFAERIAPTDLRTVCACYLLYVAWTLWRSAGMSVAGPFASSRVHNHAIIKGCGACSSYFGFRRRSGSTSRAGLFLGICALCCGRWLTLGAVIGRQTGLFVTCTDFNGRRGRSGDLRRRHGGSLTR